jgi:cysteine desulfurase / selenocysteine lyase
MVMSGFDNNHLRKFVNFEQGIIFLNHASHSPLLSPVRAEYEKYFDSWQKTAHYHDVESFRIFEELRGKLAAYVNADKSRIGLSPHTTFGMNIVASGLRWEKGDNLILSEGDFPASVYPWLRLRLKGVEIKFTKTCDGIIDEDEIIRNADKRTRLIHVSWVQFNNGNRVDLEKLGQFCSDNDILFSVDGIQGAGAVPIDVPGLKIDHFTCGCQKWMMGPCGTGFYYLSEKVEEQIDPPYSGWLSVDWKAEFSDLLRYDLLPRIGPSKYEIGTYAFQDWRALNAAMEIMISFDKQAAWDHIKFLIDEIEKFVTADNRFQLVTPKDESKRSGIITFKSQNSRELFDKLSRANFVLSFREGAIRVSPHFYNTPEEITMLLDFIARFG